MVLIDNQYMYLSKVFVSNNDFDFIFLIVDPRGTGVLFFEYCRIKKQVEKTNKGRPIFWLFENVASMPTEYRLEINK